MTSESFEIRGEEIKVTTMIDCCEQCDMKLDVGEQIIQVTHGPWPSGFITPFRSGNEAKNWHTQCFNEFPLKEQFAPYTCIMCQMSVKDGEDVVYACRGTMPPRSYVRAEGRGYGLMYVAHLNC